MGGETYVRNVLRLSLFGRLVSLGHHVAITCDDRARQVGRNVLVGQTRELDEDTADGLDERRNRWATEDVRRNRRGCTSSSAWRAGPSIVPQGTSPNGGQRSCRSCGEKGVSQRFVVVLHGPRTRTALSFLPGEDSRKVMIPSSLRKTTTKP